MISKVKVSPEERKAAQWAVKNKTGAGRRILATLKSASPNNLVRPHVLQAIMEWEAAGRP